MVLLGDIEDATVQDAHKDAIFEDDSEENN